jgi:hypothetical protein
MSRFTLQELPSWQLSLVTSGTEPGGTVLQLALYCDFHMHTQL